MLQSYSLDWLTKRQTWTACPPDGVCDGSIVVWLKNIGVIPTGVTYVAPTKVLTRLDENAIPGGYLASVAFEWDLMGPSTPEDFLAMLEMETNESASRRFVASILTALGREFSYA